MQRSALCRSRRAPFHAYLLAKIGVDAAENEPLEVFTGVLSQERAARAGKKCALASGAAMRPLGLSSARIRVDCLQRSGADVCEVSPLECPFSAKIAFTAAEGGKMKRERMDLSGKHGISIDVDCSARKQL